MGSFDSKGLSTKKLAEEIERIKKNKLLKNKVVSLADYRSVHHKISSPSFSGR